jgi:hypothetical protein
MNDKIAFLNDRYINKTYRIIVKALRDAGYTGGGGGDKMEFFNKPPIKIFIRDIKGIDNPHIIIRRR